VRFTNTWLKTPSTLHGMDDHRTIHLVDDDCQLNFISREIESSECVDDEIVSGLGRDGPTAVPYRVFDVVTGQAVLERGSANSDVIEG